jgi:RNA polymerase sigma-70 factor (ECF subfamily)
MKKRFKKKDFEIQALRHLDSLYFVALKITGHREDAEDLIQETFYKAFNQANQLRDLEKCKQWMYRIMINIWKNWKGKGSREVFVEQQEHWEGFFSESADGKLQTAQKNPEEDLIIEELRRDVESALNRLSPKYRLAIMLSDIEGFSYKEISEIMECPQGTVMSRLSRARRHLGSLLTKYKERT